MNEDCIGLTIKSVGDGRSRCRDWPPRVLIFAFLIGASIPGLRGVTQDTRDVREPGIPEICTQLTARFPAGPDGPPETAEAGLDTPRIQDALDHCVSGRAVELRAEGNHTAFLTGPLELRPSVTLIVAEGATLYGTRNPRKYDIRTGSCGVVDENGHGCRPMIHASEAPHSGVMGAGVIDGQGGQKLLHQDVSWWDLAHQAKIEDKRQNCPRIIVADASDDFTLYGITLRNSPNFHVIVNRTNGFTAWGVRIDSPPTARNTDGIDPSSSTNVTITHSFIRAGDDNVAIKAGSAAPSTHMTISHNHFYSGHGMSIGSETNGGVSAIRVVDLSINGADNGLRIKSDSSRGGLVRDVIYENVCMREVQNPIVLDPFYSQSSGNLIPLYRDVVLRNVYDATPGKITMQGMDAGHLLQMELDGVYIDGFHPQDLRAGHARFLLGPGGTNLLLSGSDVEVIGKSSVGHPIGCKDAFAAYPEKPALALRHLSANALFPEPEPPVAGNRQSVIVAADGTGDFRTVQEGIDALTLEGGLVRIRPGTYREVVHAAKNHVRIEGLGDSPEQVVIAFDNSAASSGSTFKSATFFVTADDFSARNLTLANDFSLKHQLQPQGSQALALSVTGDRAVFRKVRILGGQDTLYAASRSCRSDQGPCVPTRQYFEDCYIEGHVDFIFGDSQAVFRHCTIHALAHPTVFVTAQSKHYPSEPSGYVFDHCKLTSAPETERVFLGRPWRDYATVIFLESELDKKVEPAGWSEWHPGETSRLKTAFYAEYDSNGPGGDLSHREPYARVLTEDEARKYEATRFLSGDDNWDPTKAQ